MYKDCVNYKNGNTEMAKHLINLYVFIYSLEEEMATHSSILAWKSHGQRSLVGYGPQGHKESETTEVTEHTACT